MLDATLTAQLKAYLERVRVPFELVATLDDSASGREMRELLVEITQLSDKISLRTDGTASRRPSFALQRQGDAAPRIEFAAIPMGHEFTSLVLALLQVGGHPPKVEQALIEQIQALDGDFVFETYMSLSCHNCPDVVQALNLMAVLNPRVRNTTIDGAINQPEVEARQIMAVPTIFLNGQPFGSGRMGVEEIVAKLDTGAAARDAVKLSAKAPYDMLIVGGGPAGAAAAVYAARKGIRTGVVAERFGGQTLDTLAIENYISVLETDGPKFAAALEAHVKSYDVDIMNLQRADKLIPAAHPGELIEVQLANGGSLKARSVILSTGARWREVNVPGEKQYRNAGVAYCPHCDGPLFKGKRVAVIGGGNSGRGGRDRPGECGGTRHPDRICRSVARRCRAGQQAQEPEERGDPHQRPDHRDHWRWAEGERPELHQPPHRRIRAHRARGCVRADRPGAQHRVAEGHAGAVAPRRDHRGRQGRHLAAGRVCGR